MENNSLIKNRRLELNLTLEDVAKQVGVTKATVQRWESGLIENMRRDKIALLAKALKTTPTFILGIESNPSVTNVIEENLSNSTIDENLIVSIGRDGKRTIYKIDEKDAAIVDAFLNKFKKG